MMRKSKIIRQAGFTLVELLVVLALSGIVLGAILKIFSSSNKSYAVQEEVAAMQQNLRIAKLYLTRDIRMAGAGLTGFSGPDGNRIYGIGFTNNDINGNPASDRISVNYIAFDNDGCGQDPDTSDSRPLCDTWPPLTLKNEMNTTSTGADVEENLSGSPYNAWKGGCVCNGVNYDQSTPGFMALITLPDGSRQNTFFVTGVQTGSPDRLLKATPYPGTAVNKVGGTFPAKSTLRFFNKTAITSLTYSIVNEKLMRNGTLLAEGIEDMQFAFGLDTTGDGSVDTTVVTPGAGNSLTDPQRDQVRWVRIGLVGKTLKAGAAYVKSTHPGLEDSPLTGNVGRFKRKRLQVTVKTRNIGL